MAVSAFVQLQHFLDSQIIGQPQLTQALLLALLADGHLLVEGPPGLAKTRAVNALAKGVEGNFQRVQFTPDLLPADITGTDIYRQQTSEFTFEAGPLFHNLVLADEINRAPAKVQSALLEAMAERQVTVGKKTYKLPDLFLVMATQNPLEQEGTYPLPEAQLDRFLMHLNIDYPDAQVELDILRLTRGEALETTQVSAPQITQQTLFEARKQVLSLHLAEPLEHYLVQLIIATRQPETLSPELGRWIEYGASPRATIALDRCARAHAWLAGRDFVAPEDIQNVFANILRHRIILSYEAQADGISKDDVLDEILARVIAP
jgi:MoxR-like ATPase